MMKKYFILFGFLTILISCGKDDNPINPTGNEFYDVVFDKTYDLSTGPSEASDIIESSRGGYLVAGRNKTGTTNHAALLRLDKDGNELWDKTYLNGLSLYSVIEIQGSGYIAAGGARDSAYIVRTDYEGNIIWETYHNFNYSDVARKIIQTSDTGFLVIVNSYENNGNARLIKLANDGDKNWVKIIQGDPALKIYSIKENADSTISLIATSKTFSQPVSWYITLDKNGNEIVRKSIDLSVVELGSTFYEYSVCQNSLGNYAGCGLEYFFLFNQEGDIIIKNAIQPHAGYDNVRMYSSNPSFNNGFVACGHQDKQVINGTAYTTKTTGSLFIFNSDGTFSNSLIIGDETVYNLASSVILANDNSFVSVGYKSIDDVKGVVWVKKIKLK